MAVDHFAEVKAKADGTVHRSLLILFVQLFIAIFDGQNILFLKFFQFLQSEILTNFNLKVACAFNAALTRLKQGYGL